MVDDTRVLLLLEEIADSGRAPEDVCRACPELLPAVLRGLERLRAFEAEVTALFPTHKPKPRAPDVPAAEAGLPAIPGYSVLGVLGRGGMGVVYKARHLKLERNVAIKMLLLGDHAGPSELARFRREAQAIAALRHPHIIQVYDIGEREGQPFFTMEYVEGGSLAQKLGGVPQPARNAAEMVATLAEAVQAAHAGGIVHRDLKPSNILLTTDGTPKISDFGLARSTAEGPDLTIGGTRLGTPSYMSPEQALGRHGTVGPSTDIYSLGAVLYEMLTGRPPFKAETPAETERQVIAEEPARPSRLNARIPRDLETICLKCLSKDTPKRYATASALADDLRRFLRGEPIAARPAGPLARLSKWARRRPAQAALIGVATTGTVALMVLALWLGARRAAIAQGVERDLEAVFQRERAWDWGGARAALERARARAGNAPAPPLRNRFEQLESDLTLVARLEQIRDTRAIAIDFQLGPRAILAQADADYAEAIRAAGIAAPLDDPRTVADRVSRSSVASALVAALDDWSVCAREGARLAWLLDVANRADTDADDWRRRARDAARWNDAEAITALARSAVVASQSIQLLTVLAERIRAVQGDDTAFLSRVQEAHPDDYLANYSLGNSLLGRKQLERAARYFQAAVALRPESATARNNLAVALARAGQIDPAMTQFQAIIRADPQFAYAYQGLANCHLARREYAAAIELYRNALRIQPDSFIAHTNLGVILKGAGRPDEAREHFQSALRAKPGYALAHCGLGSLANAAGLYEEGAEHYREALRHDPGQVEGLIGLGESLRELGHVDEDMALLRQAAALAPDNARVHQALGADLLSLGQMPEAIDELQTSVRLNPALVPAGGALAEALITVGRYHEAATAAEKSLALLPANDSLRPRIADLLRLSQDKGPLEDLWPGVVRGEQPPSDPAECLDLANMGYHRKHFATAARLFMRAFETDPSLADDFQVPHLSNAADVAALAGSGAGEEGGRLTDAEKAGWRDQARRWVRAALARTERALADSRLTRDDALNQLSKLQADTDLAAIRDDPAISALPRGESDECRALWADVAGMIAALRKSP